MRVLVTGASGLLGHKLVGELINEGYNVIGIYNRHSIPIEHRNLTKVRLNLAEYKPLEDFMLKMKPDVIVHAAAYTDVDGCEKNKETAWRVNVNATRSIVRVSRIIDAYLIYISTDYIFDGERGLYKEDDLPNPLNYYGLTKLLGEELVKVSDLSYTIIRPSAIYGVGGSKKSFAEFVVERLLRREEVPALIDQYVSPTLNILLAKAIVEIIKKEPTGIFNIAGERMNRYDFALRLAEVLGLPKNLIKVARMCDMKRWIARRPRDSSLDISKAMSLLDTKFYDTELALRLFIEDWSNRDHGRR